MARIRTIKPEFPHSESMGRVSRESRLCFIMLWTIADDAGRLRGNSRMLASLLFPYDDDAKNLIDKWLTQLSSEGCIARYEVEGTHYLQILNWASHQKIDKPSASKLPEFAEPSRMVSKPLETSTMDMDRDRDRDQEGNGREDSAEPQSDSPPAITIPLVDKSEFPITNEAVAEWQEAHPKVDVMQQLRQMRAWCIANPTNRKTARGINAFIVRWLGKEQDKGGAVAQRGAPGPARASEPQWRTEQRERTQQAAPGVAVKNPKDFFIDVEAKNGAAVALG